MQRSPFGAAPGGEPVGVWCWTNAAGARIAVSELGATLVALEAPDAEGRLADVTLGFESAEAYSRNGLYCGAIVGRYANRIANAAFTLEGRRHALTANAPPHCLHGGSPGFHARRWRAEPSSDGKALRLSLDSPGGEAGFPGGLQATAEYRWTDEHALILDLAAEVDAPCPVSLAPHPYWNLAGHGAASVLDHELQIAADAFTPITEDLIPTGTIEPVPPPLDFRVMKPLGRAINDPHAQLRRAAGYDHNYVVSGAGLRPAARLWHPGSGRRLTLSTDRPGLQLYTLNAVPPGLSGVKDAKTYAPRSGVALEPQAFPDAPNQPGFPDPVLRPGQVFRARTIFAFDTLLQGEPQ